MVSDRLVAIGEIGRAYGLRGEVRVMPLTDDPSRFSRLDTYVLWDPRNGGRQPCRITGSRRQGDAVLVTVDGYDSPEAAKQLAGRLLAVPETEVLPLKEGQFYPWQLEGCRVSTEEGRDVGRVLRIEPAPGHDLWVVGDEEREHLIPAVAEIVREVDLKQGRVVIRPPEGLLDL
jgi:16S rRNA processing protein RimM